MGLLLLHGHVAIDFGWRSLGNDPVALDAHVMSPSSGPVGGSGGIMTNGMSIKVAYRDGVFAPLEKVEGAKPDAVYTVFSDEELRDIRETVGWLKAAEKSFDFWNNPADAVYDTR